MRGRTEEEKKKCKNVSDDSQKRPNTISLWKFHITKIGSHFLFTKHLIVAYQGLLDGDIGVMRGEEADTITAGRCPKPHQSKFLYDGPRVCQHDSVICCFLLRPVTRLKGRCVSAGCR